MYKQVSCKVQRNPFLSQYFTFLVVETSVSGHKPRVKTVMVDTLDALKVKGVDI